MRRLLRASAVAAATVLGLTVLWVSPASAAGTNASCQVVAPVYLKPGITPKPSSGTFTSSGGYLKCAPGSTINHHKVAQSSLLTIAGKYGTQAPGDTCANGAGRGTLHVVFPIGKGKLLGLNGTFHFTRAGSAVTINGKVGTANFGGALQFTPAKGQDCVNKKITRARVTGGIHAQG